MKLSELRGVRLDYWVSRAEQTRDGGDGNEVVVKPYSSNSELAQTIIAREKIQISFALDENDVERPIAHVPPHGPVCMANTDVEAAMLCYVFHVYGNQLLIAPEGHP